MNNKQVASSVRELKRRIGAISDQPLEARFETLSQWMMAHPWACMGGAVGVGVLLGVGGSPARLLRLGGAVASVGVDIAARLAVLGIIQAPTAPQTPNNT